MAEKSYLWTTDGTGDGTGTGYTQADASNIFEIAAQCFGRNGVAANYLNGLAPSTTGANNARIATGGALVDGKPYLNSANVDVTIPSAVGGGNTRIDRVVLRASWAAQTVRITRIAGTDAASPTAPAITQNSGTTYDIYLCQALVDTSGNVTITDERSMAQVDTTEIANLAVTTAKINDLGVTTGKINDLAVTTGKIADDAVTNAKIADNAIFTAQISDGQVTETKIGNLAVASGKLAADAVIAGKIADGAVDVTASLANDIVDDTKVGNRVPQLYRRQGGNASDWEVGGVTNYTPGAIRMQCGTLTVSSSATITFPVAFSDKPLVFLTSHTGVGNIVRVSTVTATTVVIVVEDHTGAGSSGFVNWLAIGPE